MKVNFWVATFVISIKACYDNIPIIESATWIIDNCKGH